MKNASLLIFSCFLASVSQTALGEEDFAARKTEILGQIDTHIQKLQQHKSCVSSASNKEAMMDCHKSMKAWRESEHAQHAEHEKGRIDERIKNLQDKKNALNPPTK